MPFLGRVWRIVIYRKTQVASRELDHEFRQAANVSVVTRENLEKKARLPFDLRAHYELQMNAELAFKLQQIKFWTRVPGYELKINNLLKYTYH